MKSKIQMTILTAIILVFIGGIAYASETVLNNRIQSSIFKLKDAYYMMGGGTGGGMTGQGHNGGMMTGGGQGSGMMGGGQGSGMMDDGQGIMDMFRQLFQKKDNSNTKRTNDKEMLRREFREKR
jgi:hypothetical protein